MVFDTLPTEVFTHLLSFLDFRDRTSISRCNESIGEAVALTDFYAQPTKGFSAKGLRAIEIVNRDHFLNVESSGCVLCSVRIPGDTGKLAVQRQSLFKRAYMDRLVLLDVDLVQLPVAHLLDVVDGFVFDSLEIIFSRLNLNEKVLEFSEVFAKFRQKKLRLTLWSCEGSMDEQTLRILREGDVMRFFGGKLQPANDELLIRFVAVKLTLLQMPVVLTSAETLLSVFEIMHENDAPQSVKIAVPDALRDELFRMLRLHGKEEKITRIGTEIRLIRAPNSSILDYKRVRITMESEIFEKKTVMDIRNRAMCEKRKKEKKSDKKIWKELLSKR